jgi:hypothetical protein
LIGLLSSPPYFAALRHLFHAQRSASWRIEGAKMVEIEANRPAPISHALISHAAAITNPLLQSLAVQVG